MTDRELMKWALDALDGYARNCRCEGGGGTIDAAETLRARLAKHEEPDWAAAGFSKPPTRSEQWWKHEVSNAWAEGYEKGRAQREWQSVTENEIKHLWYEACQTNLELTSQLIVHLARNIEAKLKEKNT
jgi:hypothetical protein